MDSSADFSPLRVLATLWRYRISIALCLVTCVGFSALYAFTATRWYRAEALLIPSDEQASGLNLAQLANQFGGLASFAGLGFGTGKVDKDVAVARLTSRGVLESFVTDNDLMSVLFEDRWDAKDGRWRPSLLGRIPVMDDAVDLLRKRVISVNEDRRTGLITVSVTWRNRDFAAAWVADLIARVNAAGRAAAIEDARRSQAYLRAELQETDVLELREAINRLLEVQLKNEMVASVRSEYALRIVDAARVPAEESFVKPRRAVLIGFGGFVGLGLGLLFALGRNAYVTSRVR